MDGDVVIGSIEVQEWPLNLREQPLNLNISIDCNEIEGLSKIDKEEGNYFFSIGVKFCPKTICVNDEVNPTFDLNEEKPGICFDIFKVIFDKLKEENLVHEYDINEFECYIEASHSDFKFLELLSSVQTKDYYGIGFDLVNLKTGVLLKSIEHIEEMRTWLDWVIVILNRIRPEFEILANDKLEYKIENFIELEMYSKDD